MSIVDLVLRAETASTGLSAYARFVTFMDTYANSECALNFLVGDAGHDFGDYIAKEIEVKGVTLISFAKKLQSRRRNTSPPPLPPLLPPLCDEGTLNSQLAAYSTSSGEKEYLNFLSLVRGNSRLELLGTYNMHDKNEMIQMWSRLTTTLNCQHFVIDAGYGHPLEQASSSVTVHDLITGKADAGSGCGIGQAIYKNEPPNILGTTYDRDPKYGFTIPNYFYGISMAFAVNTDGQITMTMDCTSIDLGVRTATLSRGASVNALCEALGLEGVRGEGKAAAGSKITITVSGGPAKHPIDLLFKTATDLATKLQSILLELSLSNKVPPAPLVAAAAAPAVIAAAAAATAAAAAVAAAAPVIPVGTLTNDRFFKERAGEFEREVILFTPNASSHICEIWSSKKKPDLTFANKAAIDLARTTYNANRTMQSTPTYLKITKILSLFSGLQPGSFMDNYIKSQMEILNVDALAEEQRYLALINVYEEFRSLLNPGITVDTLLEIFIRDRLTQFLEKILSVKTYLSSAFGQFKRANDAKRNKIVNNILSKLEGISPSPSRENAVHILAFLSRNFSGISYNNDDDNEVVAYTPDVYIPLISKRLSEGDKEFYATHFPVQVEEERPATYYAGLLKDCEKYFDNNKNKYNYVIDRVYVIIDEIQAPRIVPGIIPKPVTPKPTQGPKGTARTKAGRTKGGAYQIGGEEPSPTGAEGKYPPIESTDAVPEWPRMLLGTIEEYKYNYSGIKERLKEPSVAKGIDDLFLKREKLNPIIFIHALLRTLMPDFDNNNTGLYAHNSLMNLVELTQAKNITDEELLQYILWLLFGYDVVIPTFSSKLTPTQLSVITAFQELTVEQIKAARGDSNITKYFSTLYDNDRGWKDYVIPETPAERNAARRRRNEQRLAGTLPPGYSTTPKVKMNPETKTLEHVAEAAAEEVKEKLEKFPAGTTSTTYKDGKTAGQVGVRVGGYRHRKRASRKLKNRGAARRKRTRRYRR